jgi:hypothetical protein
MPHKVSKYLPYNTSGFMPEEIRIKDFLLGPLVGLIAVTV